MLTKIMQLYMPEFIKKKKLNELFRFTANAFQSEPPELKGLSYAEYLLKYALFTKEQAESYLQSGRPLEEVKRRLYQTSYVFGQTLRKSLRIITWEEAVTALPRRREAFRTRSFPCHLPYRGSIISCPPILII